MLIMANFIMTLGMLIITTGTSMKSAWQQLVKRVHVAEDTTQPIQVTNEDNSRDDDGCITVVYVKLSGEYNTVRRVDTDIDEPSGVQETNPNGTKELAISKSAYW